MPKIKKPHVLTLNSVAGEIKTKRKLTKKEINELKQMEICFNCKVPVNKCKGTCTYRERRKKNETL